MPSAVVNPGAAGEWQAVLSVDDSALKDALARLRERLSQTEQGGAVFERLVGSIRAHGVPFTLTVQARSALRMAVSLAQKSRLPGTPGRLRAMLTDSGVPLAGSATVWAQVTRPNGSLHMVALSSTGGGAYEATIPTSASGVYRVLVQAQGGDLRGVPFTREELRTLAVWARGKDAPPTQFPPTPTPGASQGLDVCGLLACLLGDDGVRNLLKRNEVDPDRVLRCVKRACG